MPIITINQITYSTKTALKLACQANWKALPDINQTPKLVPHEHQIFWVELYAYHPTINEKLEFLTGAFQGIAYRQNPLKGNTTEAQIGAMDEYGNFVPISWPKAIDEAFKPGTSNTRAAIISDVKAGLRHAIRPQIIDFRKSQMKVNGMIKCAETGLLYPVSQIHIDHHPKSFDELATQFISLLEEDIFGAPITSDMLVKTTIDDPMHCCFRDPTLLETWKLWHLEQAELRPVHWQVNLTKPKA